jgi:hypothetical protein
MRSPLRSRSPQNGMQSHSNGQAYIRSQSNSDLSKHPSSEPEGQVTKDNLLRQVIPAGPRVPSKVPQLRIHVFNTSIARMVALKEELLIHIAKKRKEMGYHVCTSTAKVLGVDTVYPYLQRLNQRDRKLWLVERQELNNMIG